MNTRIAGIGCATPLGRDPRAVLNAIQAGRVPELQSLTNPFSNKTFPTFRVDPATVDDAARLPRLRRSGTISHFAVAAALDALKDAHCAVGDERLALVFATTNGGVGHTRRFFEDIAATGTHAGSPALFPETVYNAPASNIAAALGITGTVTTIVNDATACFDAIATACDLLEMNVCDRCLVVTAEEADWVICEACDAWGLADPGAAPFGEGAAALVLAREGDGARVEQTLPNTTFRSITEARLHFETMGSDEIDLLVSSASGRSFDAAEIGLAPRAAQLAPKFPLGEAFATSAMMQVVLAALLPGNAQRALIPMIGFHGQQAALTLFR
jgi:hypothetical protein